VVIRVLLADDHKVVVDGLRALLEKEADIEVVGVARNGAEAVDLAAELAPEVVVMDHSMPGLNGADATRRIRAHDPGVAVICLSMHAERRFVSRAVASGAAGYVLKDRASEDIIRGIREVARGRTYLCPDASSIALADYRSRISEEVSPADLLTDREREILQLIAEGAPTKRIAQQLHVSVKTVGTHRETIMRKLDIHSVAGLTKYAIREGLTTSDPDRGFRPS